MQTISLTLRRSFVVDRWSWPLTMERRNVSSHGGASVGLHVLAHEDDAGSMLSPQSTGGDAAQLVPSQADGRAPLHEAAALLALHSLHTPERAEPDPEVHSIGTPMPPLGPRAVPPWRTCPPSTSTLGRIGSAIGLSPRSRVDSFPTRVDSRSTRNLQRMQPDQETRRPWGPTQLRRRFWPPTTEITTKQAGESVNALPALQMFRKDFTWIDFAAHFA